MAKLNELGLPQELIVMAAATAVTSKMEHVLECCQEMEGCEPGSQQARSAAAVVICLGFDRFEMSSLVMPYVNDDMHSQVEIRFQEFRQCCHDFANSLEVFAGCITGEHPAELMTSNLNLLQAASEDAADIRDDIVLTCAAIHNWEIQ